MNRTGETATSENWAAIGGRVYPSTTPPPGPSNLNPQRQRATTLRCTMFFYMMVGVLVVIVILFLILTYPFNPHFKLDSAYVSSFNVSTSELTANWDMGLTISNPSKKIHYYSFVAYMLYNGENLAWTSLPPFDHGKGKHIRMRVNISAASVDVSDDAAKSMAADRIQGDVKFDLKLVSLVSINSWAMEKGGLLIVKCHNITISFSSNSGVGSFSVKSRGCIVDGIGI